jgi:hypothetical protein
VICSWGVSRMTSANSKAELYCNTKRTYLGQFRVSPFVPLNLR